MGRTPPRVGKPKAIGAKLIGGRARGRETSSDGDVVLPLGLLDATSASRPPLTGAHSGRETQSALAPATPKEMQI